MSAQPADLIAPVNKRRTRKQATSRPTHLRLAKRPIRDRMQQLVDLAADLLRQAEMLAREKTLSEQSALRGDLDVSEGIDFYAEVIRFEIGLIKLALKQTGGNQSRAAALLRIKPTTLNSKIKLYRIECRA